MCSEHDQDLQIQSDCRFNLERYFLWNN